MSQMLAGDPRATFVNIAPALEQPDGTISNLILSDYLHPTAQGYLDLAQALTTPILEAYLVSQARAQASSA